MSPLCSSDSNVVEWFYYEPCRIEFPFTDRSISAIEPMLVCGAAAGNCGIHPILFEAWRTAVVVGICTADALGLAICLSNSSL